MYESLKNWGRWGVDDQRGALNHLTDHTAGGSRRPRSFSGESVSLAHDLGTEPSPENPHPAQHHMLASGDARDTPGIPGYEAARDHIALDIHGLFTTHVDALSHMFVRGEMFGGRPASDVRSDGARSNTVTSMADGVVGRGVLLDVPRALGCDFLDTGEVVTVADLETAGASAGTSGGDGRHSARVLGPGRPASIEEEVRRLLRPPRRVSPMAPGAASGRARQRRDLRPDALRRNRRMALPRSPDRHHRHGPPPDRQHVARPDLSERCAAARRWEFLFTMGPLRIAKGTGCPVNPIAVL